MPLSQLLHEFPILEDFCKAYDISFVNNSRSLTEELRLKPPHFWDDCHNKPQDLLITFNAVIDTLRSPPNTESIATLEILPGVDKYGEREICGLKLRPGEVTCIVGPTGSGKSRLLADIEWLAAGDTPTGRTVLINGMLPDSETRLRCAGRLVAQITQNMNFVIDLNVNDFLHMHAQSRGLVETKSIVGEVINLANQLSGESFTGETPVTSLSGGQSRALMIADIACIAAAPVVLIDEIENAGVDKQAALDLLVHQDKIVLIATHDPLLILQAYQRVVIKHGGMRQLLITTDQEKMALLRLRQIDVLLKKNRDFFRKGGTFENRLPDWFQSDH